MQATNRTRKLVAALSIALVASMLIGAAALHPTKHAVPNTPLALPTVQAPLIGVPTGESQEGVMVYRLPSIAVTVSRSETLARTAREGSGQ